MSEDARIPVIETTGALTDAEVAEIDQAVAVVPQPRAAGVEALLIVQRHRGWVDDDALAAVAAHLGLTPAELDGAATFANLIFRRPVGRHVVMACDSVSCWILGAERVRDAFHEHLGIGLGGTTADGRFTLLPIVCLGHCDHAPALMVDDDLHGDVAPEDVPTLLEGYR